MFPHNALLLHCCTAAQVFLHSCPVMREKERGKRETGIGYFGGCFSRDSDSSSPDGNRQKKETLSKGRNQEREYNAEFAEAVETLAQARTRIKRENTRQHRREFAQVFPPSIHSSLPLNLMNTSNLSEIHGMRNATLSASFFSLEKYI